MTRVLGLDLSLTATGYAWNEEVGGVFKSKATGMRRLAETREMVLDLAHEADVVVLEGYGFSSQKAVVQGELGGVIRLALYDRRIPYAEVAPATLKKFTTGKGNADKDAMIATAIRRFGFDGISNNFADAWMLRWMGLVQYDGEPVTDYQREALGKVDWPKLEIVERVS